MPDWEIRPSTELYPLNDPQDLGRRIRRHRKRSGITQEFLSDQTGISRPTIRDIERGKDTAQVGLILRICACIGLNLFIEDDVES